MHRARVHSKITECVSAVYLFVYALLFTRATHTNITQWPDGSRGKSNTTHTLTNNKQVICCLPDRFVVLSNRVLRHSVANHFQRLIHTIAGSALHFLKRSMVADQENQYSAPAAKGLTTTCNISSGLHTARHASPHVHHFSILSRVLARARTFFYGG